MELETPAQYGPDIPYLSPSTTVYTKLEGESVPDINCSADCFPGCIHVWMKRVAVVQESNGETLSLRQLTREKAGDYTCWCNNTESRATGNISIKLIVQCWCLLSSLRGMYLILPSYNAT